MKECIGGSKFDLDTPCLLLDIDILERNLRFAREFALSAGKTLRPHAKTHKCSAIARLQLEAGAAGICVAKISEAEALIRAGIQDVLVTGPVVSRPKVERLLDCLEENPSLMVVLDHADNARELHAALSRRGLTLDVLVDVDVGLERTGVTPEDALGLASCIGMLPTLRLRGIQAYAGHAQHIAGHGERRRISLECMERAAAVFRAFQWAGFPCDILTGTGTGAFDIDCAIPELTDMQLGSYVFMDAEYLGIGWAENGDAPFGTALRLLTTVVSVNHRGFVTVDAGLKALYRDGGVPQVVYPQGALSYDWFGDEYGKVFLPEDSVRLRPGDPVELVVSHCDPTVNLFDRYYVTRGNRVVDVWEIDLRRKCQ
jgi:D-serine deaminase-like pyridoxal phosphate-dependent protein